MFGYVVINKPELKIRDYEKYSSYYCGICQSLKKNNGILGQISLSYDFTFAAVLLTALYEPRTKQKKAWCALHPTARKKVLSNEIINYVADMNLILAYYKCLDDWIDEKKFTRLMYSKAIKNKSLIIKYKYRKKVKNMQNNLKQISLLEKDNVYNIDKLSALFGNIMAGILDIKKSEWSDELRTIGFYLGKFVYILDAYDDYEKDIKKGSFNPFTGFNGDLDEWVRTLLLFSISEVAKAYETLPIVTDTGILRNIIYSGVWNRYNMVKAKRNLKGKIDQDYRS